MSITLGLFLALGVCIAAVAWIDWIVMGRRSLSGLTAKRRSIQS